MCQMRNSEQGFIQHKFNHQEDTSMKHINTLTVKTLCESAKHGGCGECQTSCQSACKTSCGIANQQCENKAQKASK